MNSQGLYPLRFLPSGHVFMDPFDNCKAAALALEETGYEEDFCLAADFNPFFIAHLMAAGFLVMSCVLDPDETDAEESGQNKYILLPKHHLTRS